MMLGMEENGQDISTEFLKLLGKRIKNLRRGRKLSQEKLGFACGLTQHYVSQVEKGERNVSIVTLRAIAQALEVTLSELMQGLDREDTRPEEPIYRV